MDYDVHGESKDASCDKVFCTIEVTKDGMFDVEEFWMLRKAIMDFIEHLACPMMLNPSFPPKELSTFRLMFETFKSGVDIIENFFHTDKRLNDLYTVNIKFDDVT